MYKKRRYIYPERAIFPMVVAFKKTPRGITIPTQEYIRESRPPPFTGKYFEHNLDGESEKVIARFCLDNEKALRMRGPPGGGKTTFAMRFAAENGYGFYRVGCNMDTSTRSFFGKLNQSGGEFVANWGPVMEGIADGKAVILIDDVNLADKDVVAALYPALDFRRIKDEVSGETFQIPKDVIFMFAMNQGALYTQHETSPALCRRMGADITFDYLPKDRAVEMTLSYLPRAKDAKIEQGKREIAEGLWEGTNALREVYKKGGAVAGKDEVIPMKEMPGDGLIVNVMQMLCWGVKVKVALAVGMTHQVLSDFTADVVQKTDAAVELVRAVMPGWLK